MHANTLTHTNMHTHVTLILSISIHTLGICYWVWRHANGILMQRWSVAITKNNACCHKTCVCCVRIQSRTFSCKLLIGHIVQVASDFGHDRTDVQSIWNNVERFVGVDRKAGEAVHWEGESWLGGWFHKSLDHDQDSKVEKREENFLHTEKQIVSSPILTSCQLHRVTSRWPNSLIHKSTLYLLLYEHLWSTSLWDEPQTLHNGNYSASKQTHCILVMCNSEWV